MVEHVEHSAKTLAISVWIDHSVLGFVSVTEVRTARTLARNSRSVSHGHKVATEEITRLCCGFTLIGFESVVLSSWWDFGTTALLALRNSAAVQRRREGEDTHASVGSGSMAHGLLGITPENDAQVDGYPTFWTFALTETNFKEIASLKKIQSVTFAARVMGKNRVALVLKRIWSCYIHYVHIEHAFLI